jgi:hypothetical protein
VAFATAAWEHSLQLPKWRGTVVDTEEYARQVFKMRSVKSRSFSLATLTKTLGLPKRLDVDPLEGRHKISDLMEAAKQDVVCIRALHHALNEEATA